MKQRCSNPNTPKFHLYGGRGIAVAQEWADSFTAFESWALSNGYADNLSLDRIDGNLGYEPQNCRWATPRQQACNRSRNYTRRSSEFKGVSWHKRTGMWRALIGCNGKQIALGYFHDERLAAKAYNDAALRMFGEYAALNAL